MDAPTELASSLAAAAHGDRVHRTPFDTWRSCGALIVRSFASIRLLFGLVCALLVLFQLALVVQASDQYDAQAFSRIAELMPSFLRRTLGELTFAVASFQGVVCAAYFHPVTVLFVAQLTVYLGTEPAHEVESGLIDLILARPVPRHVLITRSLVLVALAAIVVPAVMSASLWVALAWWAPAAAPWPTGGVVLGMSVGLAAVASCFGALGVAVASRARRRSVAMTSVGVAAVLLYLLTFLEPTWAPARAIGWLSPFHYFRPIGILAGRHDLWRDVTVLGAATLALAALAYWSFSRSDL